MEALQNIRYLVTYINIYNYIENVHMFILISFVKFLLDIRKIIAIMRRQKIIKRIIFSLFLLQKVKFGKMTKNEYCQFGIALCIN